ncbi:MAG: efflux RND transporter periplasmic adaptor subunit [Lewinellaceae bacterium]|nr:efflux RND transporter periplasmic adaptor subunit [Lewinellaceae bacterium]
MKLKINQLLIAATLLFTACGDGENPMEHEGAHVHEAENGHHGHDEEGEAAHLSAEQFAALQMKTGELPRRNISSVVEASGQLEVPPQNEATVTAVVGANVAFIEVIEGDDVKKGQVLAYLSHPNITRMQSEYLEAYNKLLFLEQEYQRQKTLYEKEVGSGREFQQTQADYRAGQAMVKSYELQLRQLGLNPAPIREGEFYSRMPVASPISGTVTLVEVKTGQYVQPSKNLFEVVNIGHIHADLMVFEKDVYKVEKGQQVRFTVETLPGRELYARIYSVGKKFERGPKAVHVHAEIENKTGKLIPGMYIKGEILTDSTETFALPEEAITRDGSRHVAFLAEKEEAGWMFTPVEVVPGSSNAGWVGVDFLRKVPQNARFALNNAYYLIAEMKKGEADHSH